MVSLRELLSDIPKDEQIRVEVHDLSAFSVDPVSPVASLIKKPLELIFGDKPQSKSPQALEKVNFRCLSGEVTLVLSPTPAEEPTLISLLALQEDSNMRTEGSVLYNCNKAVAAGTGQSLVAAVLKEEYSEPSQRVRGALLAAAHGSVGPLDGQLVDALQEALGLEQWAHCTVGGSDDVRAPADVLKRLQLAQQLFTNPPVLVIHEPFEEAPPERAAEMMLLLKELAAGGRTVIIGTDEGLAQDVFEQVDRVLLLSRGEVMYFGTASAAEAWFAAQDFKRPEGMSVADFLVEISDGAFAEDPEEAELERQEAMEVAAHYLKLHPEGYQGGPLGDLLEAAGVTKDNGTRADDVAT